MTDESTQHTNFVIGISAVSGGGKTALSLRLVDLLQDAVAVLFDDYDESSVIPDFPTWFADGADYDAFKTLVFTEHIRTLKNGKAVTSPVSGSKIEPAKYIVVDAPLGRLHEDSGKYIDLMVFIDTPLDVAMARRLSRDLAREGDEGSAEAIDNVKADMGAYPNVARPIYVGFVERIKPTCDLVLDGSLSLDELAAAIVSDLESIHPT